MEGGMRVPFVASWPGKITADSVSDEVTSTIDLLPTFAKLTDTTGELTNEIDGHDISHILNGKRRAKSPHDAFYYYFRANLQAVRSGPWKLHFARQQRTRGQQEPTQLPDRLYNLDDDISESKNVAEQHPEVVAKLKELAETARTELGDGNSKGTGQREAGRVDKPVALRKQQ
jgi:arylsulfatase A-like enzyme